MKLKPCPFCGEIPTWHIGGAEHDILFFGCRQPNTCISWSSHFTKPYYQNALQILENRWNARHEQPNEPSTTDFYNSVVFCGDCKKLLQPEDICTLRNEHRNHKDYCSLGERW